MKLLLATILIGVFHVSSAQSIDTIRTTSTKLKTSRLREGANDYMVFLEDSAGNRSHMSIWTRDLRYETIYGKEMIVIRQRWHSDDSMGKRSLVSYNARNNFEPIFQRAETKNGTEAFNFYPDKVTGADTVVSARNKNFSLAQTESVFNWELDLEIFSTLPLAMGKSFAIPFYHPGSPRAGKFYTYTVKGTQAVDTWNGIKEDCWVLEVIYNPATKSRAEFFISRKSYDLIRMREVSGKIIRYKIKMGTASLG